jgi:GNAT superfamily N-acetyltransferase
MAHGECSLPLEWQRERYVISTDPGRLDREAIWRFLRTSYWSPNVRREVVEAAIDNSLVFGLFAPDGDQAGFARAVTDRARFAWLADVFVLDEHRGRGLGVWLVQTALSHPDLASLRIVLGTADAHGLYARFGFAAVDSGRMMERAARPADARATARPCPGPPPSFASPSAVEEREVGVSAAARTAELFAALSLATDLGTGQPFEHDLLRSLP